MIIRNPLQCTSCSARVITRTAPGLFPPQEHRFPCPGCGVEILFTLKQSKPKKVGFSFGRPINAKWVKSEKGAVKTLNFDPDRVAPKDTTNVFSPFLAEAPRMPFAAHRAYAREEGLRRAWRESQWPWIQRLIVHFDSGNLALFDKEAKLKPDSEHVVSWATRLRLLYSLFERAFDNFTLNRRPAGARVHQRIALAQSTSTVLFDELVKLYATSSRVAKIWQELMQIRTSFLTNYPSIRPVLRAQIYWSRPPKDLADFEVSEKRFDQLKQLYVDCFETLCRLTVIAVGLEAIIHHNSLNIETAKDSMTLWDYEAMHNGNKHTILGKYPIHDLFVPVIDHKLRNGLGHNSAIYIPATDEVVYYKQDDDVLLETRIAYTEFVLKVLQIFSVMELGAIYFHSLHIKARETYMK